MDLINDKLSKIYLKYLAAAFGSAFMGSVFGLVDMVMVGQYHGPEGSEAMGVIAPVWNIVYSFGLLAGIGGSVLFSVAKGSDGHGERPANAYFTGSVIFGGIIALLLWVGLWLFEVPLLRLFGALIMLLPLLLGSNSVWWAMPIAEAVTAVYVTASIVRVQKAFQKP